MNHYIGDGCHTGHEQDAEIARLRAEVERLREEHDLIEHVWIPALKRERDEALAQVAVLIQHLRHWWAGGPLPGYLERAIKAAPDEARALLDRLQRQEMLAEAIAEGLLGSEGFVDWKLGRVGLRKIREALAAWEKTE